MIPNKHIYLFADSGGGGAPAPSSGSPASPTTETSAPAPTPDTSSPSDAGGAGESLDFESIFHDTSSDVQDLGLIEPSTTVQPTPAQPPQAAPPAQPQPPPQVQPQAPAQAPTQQPQPQQAQPAVPPSLDRYDPAQLVHALAANEQQLTDVLAAQVMKLSPQEVEALETNVVEAIPRLMARVLVQAQKSALSQMAAILPVAISRHNDVTQKAGSAEQSFYQAWPQLNRNQHGQLVYGYASVFRRMYPQATLQDLIKHVGPMVVQTAGVSAVAPRAPQASRANGRSPQPSPFVPAGAGAGPVSGQSRNDMTPWEAMFVQQE
jgi:hypothetical protein